MNIEYLILDDGRGVIRADGVCYTKTDGVLHPLLDSETGIKCTDSGSARNRTGFKTADKMSIEKAWSDNQKKLERLQKLAEDIAREAHKGQVDKAGADYILHPLAVAQMCPDTETRIVALLHDTIEDTYVTADFLRDKGFPKYIVDAVLLVTKEKDFDEEEYFTRISRSVIARTVKMADLMNNMDPARMRIVTDEDISRQGKYRREFRFLFTHDPMSQP